MKNFKITLVRKDKDNQLHRRLLTINEFMERITYDTKKGAVDELRQFLWDARGDKTARFYNHFLWMHVFATRIILTIV
jgi:hypothetical protein